jgi:hypothetical protein
MTAIPGRPGGQNPAYRPSPADRTVIPTAVGLRRRRAR